jgi:peptidoglycan/LPS O-acetylase OafA/YrhL
MVLAFHERISGLPGGFLGVDVFFVISGYLITDLLASPWDQGGRLDLRAFWIRRARRLLPCLAVVLVTVTAAVAVLEPDQLPDLRPGLLAAVTYTSNWWQALHHQSYFAVFGPPPPLQHLWSLAIEEQFYLFWPLILTVVLCACARRRTRAVVIWLGAAASAVIMAVGYTAGEGSARLYYGTDTHAIALLVGAGLALRWPLRRIAAASDAETRRLDLIGLVGLSVLAWELVHVTGRGSAVYQGGIALAALAAGALVVAVASSGALGKMIGWAPLRWIGVRSYGIYLWHWPVIAIFAARAGAESTTFGVRAAETALTITLAAASWRWIEAPILRDGFGVTVRRQWGAITRSIAAAPQSPQRVLAALIPLAAIILAGTAGYGVFYSPSGPTLQQQLAAGAKISAASRTAARSHESGNNPAAAGGTGAARPDEARPGEARPGEAPPGGARSGAARPGASKAASGPAGTSPSAEPTSPSSRSEPPSAQPTPSSGLPTPTSGQPTPTSGQPVPRSARPRVAIPGATVPGTSRPPASPSGTAGRIPPRVLGRDVTAIGDSVMLAAAQQLRAVLPGSYIDAQVSRQMSQGIAVLRQLALQGELRPIVVVGLGTNGPIPRPLVRALLAVAGPQRTLVLVNTFVPRPWQSEVNAVVAAAARRYGDVTMANWYTTIRNRTGLLWGDGVHPQPAGAVLYARMVSAEVRRAASRIESLVPARQPGVPSRSPQGGATRSPQPGPPASPQAGWQWHKLGV